VQKNFLGRYFVKNFLAAVLLALPDIFQHCVIGNIRINLKAVVLKSAQYACYK
jgi:hypothetical protein